MSLIFNLKWGALASLLFLPLTTKALAFEASASGSYIGAFEPSDPIVAFSLGVSRQLDSRWSLSLSQDVTKNLIISSETDEWDVADTRAGFRYHIGEQDSPLSYSIAGSLTLPLSKGSQHAEIYSKPKLSFAMNWAASDWISVDGSVYVRDTVSAYETTPSDSSGGGYPIEDYSYGVLHSLTLFGNGYSGGYSASYMESRSHKQDRTAAEVYDYRSDLPDQGYEISFFIGRELWKGASVSVALIQGTALLHEGYEDYVVFDSATSLYAITVDQAF